MTRLNSLPDNENNTENDIGNDTLRWRGQARGVGFAYADGQFVSDSMHLCGFVYLVGPDEGERSGPLNTEETIKLHYDRDQAVDLHALRGVFDQPRTTAWSDITIAGDEPYDGIWLRLTVTDGRVCRLDVHSDVPAEIAEPVQAFGPPHWLTTVP